MPPAPPDLVLHVGCGNDPLPEWLEDFEEKRLDICADFNPDFTASMTDMGEVGTYGVVFCSHSLEHVHGYEVNHALKEFHRVLRPGGHAIVIVPDLEGVSPTEDVLYESPSGPITGLDMYYGKQDLIETMPFMAHHTAFTSETLESAMKKAGFGMVEVRRLESYNLLAVGVK